MSWKGKDAYGNPVMLPPDPSVADQMDRTRTIIYNLTPLALEYLQMRMGTSKAGDPKHLRVIEKLLKQEYWPKGYFTVVDWGEGSGGKPDIAVMKPRTENQGQGWERAEDARPGTTGITRRWSRSRSRWPRRRTEIS